MNNPDSPWLFEQLGGVTTECVASAVANELDVISLEIDTPLGKFVVIASSNLFVHLSIALVIGSDSEGIQCSDQHGLYFCLCAAITHLNVPKNNTDDYYNDSWTHCASALAIQRRLIV